LSNKAQRESVSAIRQLKATVLALACRLLASSCQDVQEHAAAALMNMARDIIYGIPVAIAAAGGIPALVR
jgi:hypothetical protein